MKPKRTINLTIPQPLLEEFNGVCAQYGHGKQKGLVLSAAILMFIRADPRAQGQCIEELIKAEVAEGVQRMLERVRREQAMRVAAADAAARATGGNGDGEAAAMGEPPALNRPSKRRPPAKVARDAKLTNDP